MRQNQPDFLGPSTEAAMILDVLRLTLFPAMMAFAASSDLLTMTISNRVSLILVGGFFGLALASGIGGTDILMHLGAGAAVLVAGFICFARGWMGGGDAKLAAATALWFGFDHLLDYVVYASLIGGALTLLLLQYRMIPIPRLLAAQEWAARLHQKDCGVPYGIALAVAGLCVYPDTIFVKAIGL
jgi:prepilin peptidase CpaA